MLLQGLDFDQMILRAEFSKIKKMTAILQELGWEQQGDRGCKPRSGTIE
jgi:hypothetical protein